MTLSRRASRRTAFFLLYQWDVTGQPLASLYEGEVDEFARDTADAVAARVEELDRRISARSSGTSFGWRSTSSTRAASRSRS